MLVGNDVVDLRDPQSSPEALHARFDERAFTAEEREALSASVSRHALRWAFWAAKESAYKVAKKLDPTVRFFPRDFAVRRMTEGRAVVIHRAGLFDVRLDSTDDWVCAVATIQAASPPATHAPVRSGVARLEGSSADPSRTVRELVCAALGPWMNLPPERVRIAADGGVPVALWRGRRLAVDLSLAHHGRFVAWAWGECAIPEDQRGFVAA